jgi:hypothetical protein
MNPLFEAAHEVERACLRHGFRFCFIGGLAVQRWGEPRLTLDVDLTLLTGFGNEAPFVDGLLADFQGRIDHARAFALEHRVLLLAASNHVPIDISLGAMDFEERAITRASAFDVAPGILLTTCSAEDLIVHKVFAGRDKDWLDVRGIVERQGKKVDLDQIKNDLLPLLELRHDTTGMKRLEEMFAKATKLGT